MGTCEKCGYGGKTKEKFNTTLCSVCFHFSPDLEANFNNYVGEKIDSSLLDTFRKYSDEFKNEKKNSMLKKASQGNLMSRAPFGYKIIEGKLVPGEKFREVEEIFESFLNEKISLNQLSKKHNLSVNGLKKILKNFTYIGKIKFNNQIYEGEHPPILSSTLFNHVQNKLEQLGIR
jgi:DNA invertase Pin-like site-specific DNA recombinase